MRINRRQFLKGASASAFLAGSNVLALAARRANAFTPDGRAILLINLSGGNDYLNTVIPLDDVGAPQRSTYQSVRPDLAIPLTSLAATEIGPCAVLGTGLALHPQMGGLAALYQEGKLAVVNGVGYPNHSLSHFEAEAVWWAGNTTPQGSGWMGRFLDTALPLDVTHALSFGGEVNTTFVGNVADALGVREVQNFRLPDDAVDQYEDLVQPPARLGADLRRCAGCGQHGRAHRPLGEQPDREVGPVPDHRGRGLGLEQRRCGLGPGLPAHAGRLGDAPRPDPRRIAKRADGALLLPRDDRRLRHPLGAGRRRRRPCGTRLCCAGCPRP